MYDYGLSVLEQYGLNALSSGRVRGALLCRTERGPVILREFHGSEKKLSMQQQLLEKMKEQFAKTSIGGNVHAEEENNRQL